MADIPNQPFSVRFGVRPRTAVRAPDDLPVSARVHVLNVVDRFRQAGLPGAYSLAPRLASAIGRASTGNGDFGQIRDLLQGAEWWEFYDICEELVRISSKPEALVEAIEAVFAMESLPYRIDIDGIQWRMSHAAEEIAADTTRLLTDREDLQGPALQWEKARQHLSRRPPDAENCIKDAVGSLEGVGRILTGRDKETLGKLLDPLASSLGIHPTLKKAMSNLYGYRGDEDGVAHGATAPPDDTRTSEAELILHWSGAAIVYLIKKSDTAGQS